MATNLFYVYLHRRSHNGVVFYIGKGSGKRAWKKTSRSDYWKRIENKYGRNVEIVKDGLQEHEAFELEKELIAYYGRYTLCNLNDGGFGGVNPSEETRLKMSIARTGTTISEETREKKRVGGLGRKHSEETKTKIAAYFTGRKRTIPVTEQERINRSRARVGIVFTDEHKKNISIAKKGVPGKKLSLEAIEKLRQLNLGRPCSEETRKKISEANLGRKHTPEALIKMKIKSKETNAKFKRPVTASNGMEFESATDAATWLKRNGYPTSVASNICSCCRGSLKTAYGLTWRYTLI